MTTPTAFISLFGPAFSPAEAERTTGLRFTETTEVGGFARYGRYRREPSPRGHAVLEAPESLDPNGHLDWLIDAVAPHMEAIRRAGMAHGKLHVTYVHDGLCNLEYRPDRLAAIARLGLLFCISCEEDAALFEEGLGPVVPGATVP